MADDQDAFNPIFDRMVKDGNDLEGLLAYAVYKLHKRDWLLQHNQKYHCPPTDEETRIFVDSVMSDTSAYELRASQALVAFGEEFVNAREETIALEAIEKHVKQATDDLTSRLGFWRGVGAQIISFFVVGCILVLVTALVERTGVDLQELFFPDQAEP